MTKRVLYVGDEIKTDKFRIVPHSPFVFRIERLFQKATIKKEVVADVKKILWMHIPVYKTVEKFTIDEEWLVGVQFVGREVEIEPKDVYFSQNTIYDMVAEFKSIAAAEKFIEDILEFEKDSKAFMELTPKYVGEAQ